MCIQIAAVTVLFVSSLSYIYFISYDPEEPGCTVTGRYTPELTIYYTGTVVVLTVMAFVTPFVVLTVLIIHKLRTVKESIADNVNTDNKILTQAERNLAKTLVAVSVAFLVLSLPYFFAYIVDFLKYFRIFNYSEAMRYETGIVKVVLEIVFYVNYAINLFLYLWYNHKGLLKGFSALWSNRNSD